MEYQFKQTAACTYLCAGESTDWATLPGAIGRVSEAVRRELEALGINRSGPATLFYRFQNDPHRPEGKHGQFLVEAQCPVDRAAEQVRTYQGPLTLRTIGAVECAFLVHRGPIPVGGLPWYQVREFAEGGPCRRTLEEREVYVRFGGGSPDNDIIELQCLLAAQRG